MSNTILHTSLENLRKNKDTLNRIEVDQRKAAIETHEPLVIANVPATMGELAVLLRRIDYMTSSGIEFGEIVIISPTIADVENICATNRFTGNMTIEQFITKISGNYPIRYKNVVIYKPNDKFDDLNTILQFISENKQSLFIVNNADTSVVTKELIDSGVFTVYNL